MTNSVDPPGMDAVVERAAKAAVEVYNRHRVPGSPDDLTVTPVDYEMVRAVIATMPEHSSDSSADWRRVLKLGLYYAAWCGLYLLGLGIYRLFGWWGNFALGT